MSNIARTIKLDLHVHSQERSACARSSAKEMITVAIERGLDGLVFTDHNRLIPPGRVADLQQAYAPFAVFGGIEVTVSLEHVLVLGLGDRCLETRQWTYPDLHAFVRNRGGYLVLAHPYRYRDTIGIDVETYAPDAIELRSKNIRSSDEDRIRALGAKLGAGLVCNSDAHSAADVGRHFNVLEANAAGQADLVNLLRTQARHCGGNGPRK